MRQLGGILAGMALAVVACSSPGFGQDPAADDAPGRGLIGIAMPARTPERWVADAAGMVAAFEAAGYSTDVEFAGDDVPKQLAQIEEMIARGAAALVITATDGTALASALASAEAAGIPVIAYDRLIRDSAEVDYYATFDNFGVGVLQGKALLACLGPLSAAAPKRIELFGGALADSNAYFFYDGAMSVLEPLIDAGEIEVGSGETGMDTVGTLRWDGTVAAARMASLLAEHYSNARLDGVLSPYDGLSIAIVSTLEAVGYGGADMPMPCVTGQDAEIASVRSIIAGKQSSTVFKDTRALAKAAAGMVETLLAGGTPEIDDTRTYDNGVKVVPARVLAPVAVDRTNWEQVLVESGYYTRAQIGE